MSEINALDARQRRMRSLDIIRVHNTTSEDFVFWSDKLGVAPKKTIVPKAQKDIGKGRGNNDLPRYLAQRFTKKLIEQIITKRANQQLKDIRDRDRRLPRGERLQSEETEVVRTNDTITWEDLFPKIWLGVIEKYGGEDIFDPGDGMPEVTGNSLQDTMENLGIADKPYVKPEITKK